MIEELDMPEHSKGLMNLDKLTLPKLIWLIKISWQEMICTPFTGHAVKGVFS